jgi:glutathione S-transferase
MMKIHDYKGFPNPARIRIALAEKGLTHAVEFVTVDVPAGEHKRPEFLARNPAGTVPVLELQDGTHIAECTAITEYLDHLDRRPILTGKTARERALTHMMQRRAEATLLDAVATYFHHATPGLGPHIEIYQNREWGEKNRERALAGMRYFDEALAHQPHLAGERFTMADITAFAGLAFADIAKIKVPTDLVGLRAWRGRVAERPSVAYA